MESILLHGDCLEVLRTLPDNSVDSVVTDPPYGLSFMGKKWDYDVPCSEVWAECLRVLKPGGHLLAFAGTRTQHRMAVRIEDAGFEIRDMIAWVYGSGFPKSLDVSKAIDKAAGAEREVVGSASRSNAPGTVTNKVKWVREVDYDITAPATEAARQWQGWGTALKPALEPITVARKPLIGTVAENVLAHGTGALNIDASRIPTDEKLGGGAEKAQNAGQIHEGWQRPWMNDPAAAEAYAARIRENVARSESLGRWPANLIHDGSEEVVGLFPETPSAGRYTKSLERPEGEKRIFGSVIGANTRSNAYAGDTGSAARFFYCAKASKRDRDEANTHPTVKPTDLMRYLCRLVTPPNGTVLDPFMGSGSTGKAAKLEGFAFIGIEREADYLEIAKARIEGTEKDKKR